MGLLGLSSKKKARERAGRNFEGALNLENFLQPLMRLFYIPAVHLPTTPPYTANAFPLFSGPSSPLWLSRVLLRAWFPAAGRETADGWWVFWFSIVASVVQAATPAPW